MIVSDFFIVIDAIRLEQKKIKFYELYVFSDKIK